ncbi:hypothetical protein RE628_24740 [Paenibacillus sp. D2_2]|uniref:ABC transporter permease/M1 family aminopeptidase n=1 Tax=Paenibacillus sp. D2_2 TaxID=3073092 RepID=UPI002814F50D|nr:hypothetical protein [Paenibacillus sp. D2_2]WMT40380.1 hypothetical protein RE628_24740 [Paenibacillus sp. D2_2]
MHKWLRQFRFELGMILRRPPILAMPFLFGALLWWSLSRIKPADHFFSDSYNYYSLIHTMSLGLVMLIGILTIRRDVRRSSYEWSAGLPVSYGTIISAKYMAGLLYFTSFTVLASGIYFWLSTQRVTAEITMQSTMFFTTSFEMSYAVTLALAMLLAICIPNRIVYLIGFCAWMFGTFFMEMFILERYSLDILRTFHLSQLFVSSGNYADTWGLVLTKDELRSSHLFVLAFTVLMLVIGVTVLQQLRPSKHRRRTWGLGICSVMLAAAAFIPYAMIWQERYTMDKKRLADPSLYKIEDIQYDRQPKIYGIKTYNIYLQKLKDDTLQAEVTMNIPADDLIGKTEISLTLNRMFKINHVSVNGQEVATKRQGEKLSLELSQVVTGPLTVEMDYSGKVMDYSKTFRGTGRYYAFVKGENVFLPGYLAWYPLPEDQPIYLRDNKSIELGAVYTNIGFPSADFKLTVSGFEAPIYTSLKEVTREAGEQIYSGEVHDGVTLFGGGLEELEPNATPLHVVYTPYNKLWTEQTVQKINELDQYFRSWLPTDAQKVKQLLYIPNQNFAINSDIENNAVVLNYISVDQNYMSEILMNKMLLGTRQGSYLIENVQNDIRLQLRALIWYVYYYENGLFNNGNINGYMLSELYANDWSNDKNQIGVHMRKQVDEALKAGKNDQVKRLLKHFYDQGLEIPELDQEDSAVERNRPIPYSAWEDQWKKVIGE